MFGSLIPVACSRSRSLRILSSILRPFCKPACELDSEVPDDTRKFVQNPRGYVSAYRWMNLRMPDERLERLLFGDSVTPSEKSTAQNNFLANQMNARLTGIPVDENFVYHVVDSISEVPLLDHRLHENLFRLGLDQLTPVQRHAVGIMSIDEFVEVPDGGSTLQRVVGKYDLMAAAQTGSGKTLAYLIPLMNRLLRVYPYEAMQNLLKTPSCQYPSGLVLAPTRELVQQIQAEIAKLCYRTFLRSVALFGGERPGRQAHELSLGSHLVVATPGRLLDFLRQNLLALHHCRSLVVDEADRLLDMGFEEQLREIVQSPKFGMPPPRDAERQTCLYSATFPRDVTLLARSLLRGSRCISLTLCDQDSGTVVPEWGKTISRSEDGKQQLDRLIQIVPKEIKQRFELVEEDTIEALHRHLTTLIRGLTGSTVQSETSSTVTGSGPTTDVARVLVFCNTKREVDTIDAVLYRGGLKSAALHGDKPQAHRTQALHLFRKGVVRILVASSVASRGLDIPNVTAVVSIGTPNDTDDYVHRIGRTGRLGQPGEAITVLNETLLNSCSPSVLSNILQIVHSSQGGLDSVPKPIVQFVKQSSSNLNSFESHSNHSSYQKRRSSSFGRQRSDASPNALNRRYS